MRYCSGTGSLTGVGASLTDFVFGLKALGGIATSGFGFAVGGITAAVIGYGHLLDRWKEAQNTAKETYGDTSELVKTATQMRESNNENIKSAEDNIAAMDTQAERAKVLVDRIRELNGAVSTSEQEELLRSIEQLNAIYPEWGVQLDETGRKLDENSKKVLQNADSMIQASKKTALEGVLSTLETSRAWEQLNNDEIRASRSRNQSNWNYFREQENALIREYRALGYDFTNADALRYDSNWQGFLGSKGIDQDAYYAQRDLFQSNIAQSNSELSASNQQLAEYDTKINSVSSSIAQFIAGVSEATGAVDAQGRSLSLTAEQLAKLSETFAEIYEQSIEYTREQFASLEEFEAAEDVSIWKVLENLEARKKAAEEYYKNLEEIQSYLDTSDIEGGDEFFSNLMEGEYGDPATYAQTFASAIRNGNTDEVRKAIEDMMSIETWAEKAAEIQTILTVGLDNTNDIVVAKIWEITDNAVDAMAEAEGDLEEAAIRDAAAADISRWLSRYEGDVEDAAELLGQAVEDGILSKEDAIAMAAEHLGNLAVKLLQMRLRNIAIDVNVDLIPHVNYTGDSSGGRLSMNTYVPMNQSTGGLIPMYASTGKLVAYRPVGTDTVPAMLTPGEFVHNTKAVSTFGRDFMEKVNSLNIPGAFESLIRRFSTPNMGSYVTHNQYSRDNHAVVNQNIITNNQNYSQRVARRFVYGL